MEELHIPVKINSCPKYKLPNIRGTLVHVFIANLPPDIELIKRYYPIKDRPEMLNHVSKIFHINRYVIKKFDEEDAYWVVVQPVFETCGELL